MGILYVRLLRLSVCPSLRNRYFTTIGSSSVKMVADRHIIIIIIILFFIKKLTNATYDKIYKLQSL